MSEALRFEGVARFFRTPKGLLRAVDGVSFSLPAGGTLGLVGESGCGKSTVGKLAVGLERPDSGAVRLDGAEVAGLDRRGWRPHRHKIQMVFQDPFGSLNPKATVGRILAEPFLVHGIGDRREREARVAELVDRVGLPRDSVQRQPHEFSGGQRQRIGIARALALRPRVIVCDEPVSALDVSVQAQVLNLFVDLQREFGLAYLFISHDLSVVEYMADRVLVMYLGQIVENASYSRIMARPLHPYTQGLVGAAVPAGRAAARPRLAGEVPSPVNPPSGCRFHTRCPHAEPRCRSEPPALRRIEPGHEVACHLVAAAPAAPPA